MNSSSVVLTIFLTALVNVNCQAILKEMDKAYDLCIEEYNVTVNEFSSTYVNLTCLNSCIAVKVGFIEDKKFNLDKYEEYLLAIGNPRNIKGEMMAYQYCEERMLDMRDECESFEQLEKCVDKLLARGYKKQ